MVIISGILSLVLKSYGSKVLQKSLIFTTSTKRQSLTPEQLQVPQCWWCCFLSPALWQHVTQDSNPV